MYRLSIVGVVAVLGIAVLVADRGLTQGEKKDQAAKVKGQLPALWKNLGLTQAQKDQVYDTRAKFAGRIAKLNQELKALKQQEKTYQNPRTLPSAAA
jgi:hypothetical protein